MMEDAQRTTGTDRSGELKKKEDILGSHFWSTDEFKAAVEERANAKEFFSSGIINCTGKPLGLKYHAGGYNYIEKEEVKFK